MPIRAADVRRSGNAGARENRTIPINVNVIPAAREYDWDRRSVAKPTRGCNRDAVHWYVNVIRPTCPKVRRNPVLSRGYIAGSSDCVKSLRK
jgi:hypothetical protein